KSDRRSDRMLRFSIRLSNCSKSGLRWRGAPAQPAPRRRALFRERGRGSPGHLEDHRLKIALLGNFGSGNYGNDGSLEAMARLLRRIDGSLDLLCICSDPASVRERLGVEAISISSAPITSRLFAAFDRA